MEIKLFPVLLCAVIFSWTSQISYGYTSPYIHGGKPGNGGKKDRIALGLPMNKRQICMTAKMLGCGDTVYRREENMAED